MRSPLSIVFFVSMLVPISGVPFNVESILCAIDCPYDLPDFESCSKRDAFASCAVKCPKSPALDYMIHANKLQLDVECRTRNYDELIDMSHHFVNECALRAHDRECEHLQECRNAIKAARIKKQFDQDVLDFVESGFVVDFITFSAMIGKRDIPQSCADCFFEKKH